MYRLLNDPKAPRLGEYVETTYGQHGRVTQVHHSVGVGMGLGNTKRDFHHWLHANNITDFERRESWLSVLVNGGGSVCLPASRCKIVPPFVLINNYAGEYFRDAVNETDTMIDRSDWPLTDEAVL